MSEENKIEVPFIGGMLSYYDDPKELNKKYQESINAIIEQRIKEKFENESIQQDFYREVSRTYPWFHAFHEAKLLILNKEEVSKGKYPFLWVGDNKGYLIDSFERYLRPKGYFNKRTEFYKLIGIMKADNVVSFIPGKNSKEISNFMKSILKKIPDPKNHI